jgi:hypothetical protein
MLEHRLTGAKSMLTVGLARQQKRLLDARRVR